MIALTENKYHDSLPGDYTLVDSMVELYELKKGKRKYVLSNLQLLDSTIIMYSSYSDRFYERELKGQNADHIRPFVRKMRCYIPRGRKSSQDDVSRRETLLMIEHYENDKTLQGRETKLKLLKAKLT